MMNNNVKLLLSFAGGMVAGATAMYLYFKSQFEVVEDSEDEPVNDSDTVEEKSNEENLENKLDEYNDLITKKGYKPLEPIAEAKMKEKEEETGLEQFCPIDGIHIIDPDEFVIDGDYELETLFYLRDGVVIDADDHIIDDPTSMVGDAPHHYGENPGDEDTVYVRNDEKMMMYELLREDRTSEEYFKEEFPRHYQQFSE